MKGECPLLGNWCVQTSVYRNQFEPLICHFHLSTFYVLGRTQQRCRALLQAHDRASSSNHILLKEVHCIHLFPRQSSKMIST
ncbi:hypothetical protein CapIbe_007208 [Capra ibex]